VSEGVALNNHKKLTSYSATILRDLIAFAFPSLLLDISLSVLLIHT
jgi:hypothetical protein